MNRKFEKTVFFLSSTGRRECIHFTNCLDIYSQSRHKVKRDPYMCSLVQCRLNQALCQWLYLWNVHTLFIT